MRAFSQNVAPVSSGSGTGFKSARVMTSIGTSARSGLISRTLFGLVVATSSLGPPTPWRRWLTAKDRLKDGALCREQVVDAFVGQCEQSGQGISAERLGLRGALNLDEAVVARLDDVHVDVGLGVFLVGQIEQGHP